MNQVKRWFIRLCLLPLQILWIAWTSPRTWADPELIDETIMNTHIRDNLLALKDPPTDNYDVNEASNYTTTSATFVDVDAAGDPDLSLTITTTGGDICVSFQGTVSHSVATGRVYFDITLDGTQQAGDDGIIFLDLGNVTGTGANNFRCPIGFTWWIRSVSAGSHTIKLQWKQGGGTATLYAGAATANADNHPQFLAREVS